MWPFSRKANGKGYHICPWCRQNEGGVFSVWQRDPFLDEYRCSTCQGTSLWRWEACMIYIGALKPPKPLWPDVAFYDIKKARLVGTKENVQR